MNKVKIALIACAGLLALGAPNVVRAQTAPAASGPFADVPADHWAYQSVDTLQMRASLSVIPTARMAASAP